MFLPCKFILLLTFFSEILVPFLFINGQMFPRNEMTNVTFLDRLNFYEKVFDNETEVKSQVQMIQFYLNWCSDTAAFSFEFRQFVKMVTKKWSNLLTIGLLDCATNNQICVDFENAHYPKLRMLPVNRKLGDIGQDLDLLNDLPYYSTVNDIRMQFIDWFSKYAIEGPKKKIRSDWPHFEPLPPVHSKEKLLEMISKLNDDDDTVPVWIVVEDKNSILGRELMLDFSSKTSKIRIYRMVVGRSNQNFISNNFLNYSLPFFISIDSNKWKTNITTYQLENITSISNYKALSDFVEAKYISPENIRSGHLGRLDSGETAYSTQVFWTDLHNALHYILYHEVARKPFLSSEDIHTLVSFLNVIQQYLSFPNLQVKTLIIDMRDYLTLKLKEDKNSSLPIETYLDALRKFDKSSSLKNSLSVPFSACSNVAENYEVEPTYLRTDNIPERHFPCSLWTLFHSLTVGEYLKHPLHRPSNVNRTALVATREYIVAFLGCRGCSYHFGNMSLTLRSEIPYANSSVLWLWRAHNSVNSRLKATASDVAVLAKRQFPTYQECFTCYQKLPKEAYFKNFTIYQDYYDQEAVLSFLVKYYHPNRMVQDDKWPTPDQ